MGPTPVEGLCGSFWRGTQGRHVRCHSGWGGGEDPAGGPPGIRGGKRGLICAESTVRSVSRDIDSGLCPVVEVLL